MESLQLPTSLKTRLQDLFSIRQAMALLAWDQETGMPPSSGELRGQAQATLAARYQQELTAPALAEQLQGLQAPLGSPEYTLLKELHKEREKNLLIPEALTRELAHCASVSQQAWAQARNKCNPQEFLPWLEKMLYLKKEVAQCLRKNHTVLYDVALDEYEPGATTHELSKLFADLAPISELYARQRATSKPMPITFPIDGQQKLCTHILEKMGFDFTCGRMDQSTHPFTEGLSPLDVRLTVRYRTEDFRDSFYSALHEGGHGLYEQGLPARFAGTPLAEAVSLGIHESQSRFWENQVGRSLEFWQGFFPTFKQYMPHLPATWNAQTLFELVNEVMPGFIRTDSDEISYNLHVMLRFELERDLFSGELLVKDLPERWNERFYQIFGYKVPSPKEGFLQDVHWSLGLFGYFPTYTLGNLIAAQLHEALLTDVPTTPTQIRQGDFAPILQWMRNKIHIHGKSYTPHELIKKATGKDLSVQPFLNYLNKKYP
jgi:carboxypeptidase Taq